MSAAPAPSAPTSGGPERVGVLGGGRMGAGIAHAFLLAGADVAVVERDRCPPTPRARASSAPSRPASNAARPRSASRRVAPAAARRRRPRRLRACRPRDRGRAGRPGHQTRSALGRRSACCRPAPASRATRRRCRSTTSRSCCATRAVPRPALLQPGAGVPARRGRDRDRDRPGASSRRRRTGYAHSARHRSRSPTRPGSPPRGSASPSGSKRSGCSRTASRRQKTSTRRWCSATSTRWGRCGSPTWSGWMCGSASPNTSPTASARASSRRSCCGASSPKENSAARPARGSTRGTSPVISGDSVGQSAASSRMRFVMRAVQTRLPSSSVTTTSCEAILRPRRIAVATPVTVPERTPR